MDSMADQCKLMAIEVSLSEYCTIELYGRLSFSAVHFDSHNFPSLPSLNVDIPGFISASSLSKLLVFSA